MAFANCKHEIDSNNKKQINPCKSFRNYNQIRCQDNDCNITIQNSLEPLAICLKCCKFYCTKNKHNENHSKSKQHKMSMIIPSSDDFVVFNEDEIKSEIMAIWCDLCQMFVDKIHINKSKIQLLQQSIYITLQSLLSTNKQAKKRKKKKKQQNSILHQKNNIEFSSSNKKKKKKIRLKHKENNIQLVADNNKKSDKLIEEEKLQTYNCIKCTFINDITSEKCVMCETKYIAPEIGKCFVCNASRDITPLFQCKRCHGWKRYCSVICQHMDWNKSHKLECIEIENKDNKIDDDFKYDNNAVFEWNNIDFELNNKINNLEIKLKEERKCLKNIFNELKKLKEKQIENNLFIESCELNWKQWKSSDFIKYICFIESGYFNEKYSFENVNVDMIDKWSNLYNYIKKDKRRKYFLGVDLKFISVKKLRNDLFEFMSYSDSRKLCKYIRKLINGELNNKEEEFKYDLEVNDEDIKLCTICMDNNKSHALSCGHLYCEVCARQLKKCSFCNKNVTTIIKLFNLY